MPKIPRGKSDERPFLVAPTVFPEARNVADGNEMALRRVPEAPNVAHSNEMAGRRFPILVWPARLSLMGDECPDYTPRLRQ